MNVYMLAKIGNEVIDTTDLEQVMVHGADNYSKAAAMLKTMSVEQVKEYFCSSCGGYKPNKERCICNGE